MSKLSDIFTWLRTCPQLESLYSIAATEAVGVSVVFPMGASQRVSYEEAVDVTGGYECDVIPFPSVYEDFRVNCYAVYDARDESEPGLNINVLSYDEVQAVCDWIADQDETGNFPEIEGKQIISVECVPFVPQIQYVNDQDNIVAYYITIRLRYVNTAKRRNVYYGYGED